MGENLGTIKIMEGRIITKKSDITQVWSTGGGDPFNYIVYNGTTYKLLNGKESEKEIVVKKKYEEIEEDIDGLDDIEDFEE
jgi:hypothetical protein